MLGRICGVRGAMNVLSQIVTLWRLILTMCASCLGANLTRTSDLLGLPVLHRGDRASTLKCSGKTCQSRTHCWTCNDGAQYRVHHVVHEGGGLLVVSFRCFAVDTGLSSLRCRHGPKVDPTFRCFAVDTGHCSCCRVNDRFIFGRCIFGRCISGREKLAKVSVAWPRVPV